MANEILLAGIANLVLAEMLNGIYLQKLADRNALPNHPALLYVGDANMKGSKTWKIPHSDLEGYNMLAQTADGAEVANTALSPGASTLSVARYSKAYTATDMAKFISGALSPERFAMDAITASERTLVDLVADTVDGYTATVGATGVNYSADNMMEAIALLEVGNVQGQLMSLLHGRQNADLREDLANASGGALQWYPPTVEQLGAANGRGYRGRFLEVDMFSSNQVKTANAGADRAGAIFGRGALLWGDMSLNSESDDQLILGGAGPGGRTGTVMFERQRAAAKGQTQYVTHRYLGASLGIDEAGVSVITDA
jgi:hypothetical protein